MGHSQKVLMMEMDKKPTMKQDSELRPGWFDRGPVFPLTNEIISYERLFGASRVATRVNRPYNFHRIFLITIYVKGV